MCLERNFAIIDVFGSLSENQYFYEYSHSKVFNVINIDIAVVRMDLDDKCIDEFINNANSNPEVRLSELIVDLSF